MEDQKKKKLTQISSIMKQISTQISYVLNDNLTIP